MVSTPRISIGPAGCRINRDYARRGWATETGHPNWGRSGQKPYKAKKNRTSLLKKMSKTTVQGKRVYEKTSVRFHRQIVGTPDQIRFASQACALRIGGAAPPRRQAPLQGANVHALQEDLDAHWGG